MAPKATLRKILLGTENADGTVTGVTTGQSVPVDVTGLSSVAIILRSIGTTTGGTVLVEEADWGSLEPIYSGTWSQTNSQAANGFTGGAQLKIDISPNAAHYVRLRISATITGGGTITGALVAQGVA